MHDGAIALAAIESNGMRIDVPYLEKMQKVAAGKTRNITEKLKSSDVWQVWTKHYAGKANLGSRVQLGHVLFNLMGLECVRRTKTGRPGTAEQDLEAADHPFLVDYLRMGKLGKLQSTYLTGIRREVEDDGFLHPFFNLHLVSSYRSSSDSPNFQNIPSRDPEFARVIRRAFIPREGHVLVEVDYSALEVHLGCPYHQDPVMIRYLETKHDFHKDAAAQCFMLPLDQVTKMTRYVGKNGFVFPEFYGSYFANIAPAMWKMIDKHKLQTADGISVTQHLKDKGVDNYSKFEDHISQVEEKFWGETFKRYDQWRQWWWERYLQRGWFRYKTGFVVRGNYRRNQVSNLVIQGSSFHCLLWSLTQLQRWLQKNKLKSKIVGQIHDSIIMDAHRAELQDVVAKAVQISTQDIRQHWKWIVTPLEVEVEVGEENWWDKRPLLQQDYNRVM